MKKRILCFGDSNTYGANPSGGRFDEDARWTGILAYSLGEDYRVIEEGLNGRTICFDDPVEGGYKSGVNYLPPCVITANPIELAIIMLGINDLKPRFGMNAHTIAQSSQHLIRAVYEYGASNSGARPKVLLVSPPQVGENIMETRLRDNFGPAAHEQSLKLAGEFQRIARLMGAEFMDAAEYARASERDQVHLDREGHASLARAMARRVREILEG